MKRMILFVALLLTLMSFTSGYAQNGTPVSDDEVNRLASDLYCPVCENVPLEVCPTRACAQWRELIREKIALGWTDEEIKAFFAAQYGDQVLALPPRRGLNWTLYILPPLLVVAGILTALRVMRKPKPFMALQSPIGESHPVTPEDYVSQVEKDLRGDE